MWSERQKKKKRKKGQTKEYLSQQTSQRNCVWEEERGGGSERWKDLNWLFYDNKAKILTTGQRLTISIKFTMSCMNNHFDVNMPSQWSFPPRNAFRLVFQTLWQYDRSHSPVRRACVCWGGIQSPKKTNKNKQINNPRTNVLLSGKAVNPNFSHGPAEEWTVFTTPLFLFLCSVWLLFPSSLVPLARGRRDWDCWVCTRAPSSTQQSRAWMQGTRRFN